VSSNIAKKATNSGVIVSVYMVRLQQMTVFPNQAFGLAQWNQGALRL
jgi:hypothetical protein